MPASNAGLDLVIVGGGIGGLICLKYARDARLNAVLLEREPRVGGLWRDLPAWQDIQIRKEDWTLGDLPLAGEDQASILANIEAWVDRFDLAPLIRLGEPVHDARPVDSGWRVTTDEGAYEARWVIAATGGHNRPFVPDVERTASSVAEFHSSRLRDPDSLTDRRVTVVGGGASAYDLLDLAIANGARSIAWVYRSTKWMRPTRRAKYFGTNMRILARHQMLGRPVEELNRRFNETLRARYEKAGIAAILPDADYDLRHHQLVPGRRLMIEHFNRIERHRGEVRSIHGDQVRLDGDEAVGTDLLLWGTGYTIDLAYLDVPPLTEAGDATEIARRCYSGFRSMDAPNLFFLAPAILESNTSTPFAYAHVARSMMSHIRGRRVFEEAPSPELTNHFDLVKMLARRDRRNYLPGLWRLRYLWLAFVHPESKPLPIP
jgi:cation diffusion facilitator CzcD-associated flavoprotein CzcO